MVDIASLSVDVQVQLGNLNAQVAQIQKATTALTKDIEQSLSKLDNIGKTVKNSLAQTRQGIQQVANVIKKLSTDTNRVGKSIETNLKGSSQGIKKITESTASSVEKLLSTTEKTAASITQVGQTTYSSMQQIVEGVKQLSSALVVASQSGSQALGTLARSGQQANRTLVTSGQATKSSMNEVNQGLRTLVNSMASIASNIQKSTQTMQASLASTGQRVNSAVGITEQAVNKLLQSIQKLQTSTASAGASTQQSIGQIASASNAAASGISATASATTAATATVKRNAAQMAAAVTNSVGQANQSTKQLVQGLTQAANTISQAVERLEKSITKLSSDLRSLVGSLNGVKSAASSTSSGIVRLNQAQQDAVSGSANLGRFMRVLTTNILGVNAVSIALGTALGNLATQLISRLIIALVDSVTQFGRLRNELASTSATMNDVGGEMEFVIEQATLIGTSLDNAGQEWTRFAEDARKAGVSLAKARDAYANWNSTVSIVRQRTLKDTFRDLGTAIGELIVRINAKAGLTDAMNTFFERVTKGVKDLTAGIQAPPEKTVMEKMQEELDGVTERLEEAKKTELGWLNILDRFGASKEMRDNAAIRAEQNLLALLDRKKELEKQLFELKWKGGELARVRNAEEQLEYEKIHVQIQRQLDDELDAAGKKNRAKEYSNKLSELENKFKQAGIELTGAELVLLQKKYGEQIKAIQSINIGLDARMAKAAQDAQQGIAALQGQRGLLGDIIWSWDEYERRRLEIENNLRIAAQEGYEADLQITELKIQEQQRLQQAMWDTAKMGVQALTQIFPKNKAFAIANAIMNTAEGVTNALAKGGPPPLNFIQAGLVAAAGAAQIASIASAKPGGGGSVKRPSSSGSSSSSKPQATPAPPQNALKIIIPKGDIWSSERVAELVERINEEVGNGRTLISTRTVPT